jgi:hypothetical protein
MMLHGTDQAQGLRLRNTAERKEPYRPLMPAAERGVPQVRLLRWKERTALMEWTRTLDLSFSCRNSGIAPSP